MAAHDRLANMTALLSITLLAGCNTAPQPIAYKPMTQPPINPALSKTLFGLAETQSFDVYADHGRIHLVALGKQPDNNPAFRYSYSDDGGEHWATAQDIAMPNTSATSSRGNDVQIAAHDREVMVIWQAIGELKGMGPMVAVHSSDSGKTWQSAGNPAGNNAGDQSHLDLAVDGNGVFHVAWLDDREENGYQGLRYSHSNNGGQQWATNVTLDGSTCSCCWNTLLVNLNGSLDVLYRDMEFRDMALTESIDQGKTWASKGKVGDFQWKFEGCPHVGGGLAYTNTSNGLLLHSVVWTGLADKQGLYYLQSPDGGKNWTTPAKLGKKAVHGDIAGFGTKVRAVWDELSAEGSSIHSAQSNDSGLMWLEAKAISSPGYNATHPRIVATEQGFLLLWTEKQADQPNRLEAVVIK